MSDIVELTLYEMWRTDEAILVSDDPHRRRNQSWIGFDKIESIDRQGDLFATVIVRMRREVAQRARFLPRSEEAE